MQELGVPSGALRLVSVLALAGWTLSACQSPGPASRSMVLDEGWTVSGVDTFTAAVPATVPGTVHTDLLANGLIPDPFWRDNEERLQWIGEKDWIYRTTFQVESGFLEAEVVELVFQGLDTFAEVVLNGRSVLETDNMFRRWSVDVKPHLLTGENTLEVRFRSPLPPALAARAALPYPLPAGNDRGDPPSRVFVRKAAYHYGWDWGPRLITSGIWRPVELLAWSGARLSDVHVVTDSIRGQRAFLTARVTLEVTVTEADRRAAGGEIPATVVLASPEGAFEPVSHQAVLVPGANHIAMSLTISEPELWWPNGMGEAHLYELETTLEPGRRGDALDSRFGIRTVELVTEPDSIGESFFFRVNGVPVFMKGANVIPLDHFSPRVTETDYRALFRDVSRAHMNMLRVWGGGIYEEDVFYDLADEHGILIWQDFMFANGMYPGDATFLESIQAEAGDQVRRLRRHPSIALWCGNNEMDEGWQRWGWARAYRTPEDSAAVRGAYDAIFHGILPRVVEQEDPSRRYWPSSPSLGWGDPESLNRGDSHYWGVWHGREPFSVFWEKLPRFSSEFGFQALPPMATVEAFTEVSDRRLFSPIFLVHQKHPIGNELITEYMERDYSVPATFEDFVYVSQLLQARGMRTAFEAHRRAMPRTMGTLYWQLNDTWPVVSWSGRDYFGRWKALHYAAREAFAPLLLSIHQRGDTVEVWGVSDSLQEVRGTMALELMDFQGTSLWQAPVDVSLAPGASTLLWKRGVGELLQEADPSRTVFLASMEEGPSPALHYFLPPKGLQLETPVIHLEWSEQDGASLLTLTSPVLAKDVYLRLDPTSSASGVEFSHNFFDLLPGQPRTVRLDTDQSVEGVRSGLRIRTLADTPREGVPSEEEPTSIPGSGVG